MTLLERTTYKRYKRSIVTEDPWLISCYPKEQVRIWRRGEWVEPSAQTLGASINKINLTVLGIKLTIPSSIMDGGASTEILLKKLDQEYIDSRTTGE